MPSATESMFSKRVPPPRRNRRASPRGTLLFAFGFLAMIASLVIMATTPPPAVGAVLVIYNVLLMVAVIGKFPRAPMTPFVVVTTVGAVIVGIALLAQSL